MSSVTNGKTLIECAAQLERKLHMDVPVSVKGSDLYILFGEKAFSNPILLKASEEGSSINKVLGIGIDKEETLWLQLCHACEWREAVCLEEVASRRDPNEWLGYCADKGGLNHIMWCMAHKRDVVSQFHWVHDMLGLEYEDLNAQYLDLLPKVEGAGQGSKQVASLQRNHDCWSVGNRRQVYCPYTWAGEVKKFPSYPLHRRGKQPRGKSLSDKRKGNLSRSYQKAYSR